MPRKPDFSAMLPDPRLDPFRERVGLLTRAGEDAGRVYVRSLGVAQRESGRLWWTRWRHPVEVPHLFVYLPGEFNDTVLSEAELDRFLAESHAGKFAWVGELLDVLWLDEAESRRIRVADFGFDKAGNE